ncbi:YcjX family protein [Halothiobacillus sp. DCM-1]|uniref:YcjX family protein n=1 Tax=Halothiobacillus sp. DCM-1 TaxID=3112558 RepID=UPI0032559E23
MMDSWFTPVLRVGVTGLSQAGKSTLITTLINHLENVRRGSLRGVPELSSLTHGHWQRATPRAFDYDAGLTALTGQPPRWPQSTTDWSVARIELSFARRWHDLAPRKQIIELVDYPGEWLLDLQLMDWSYAEFCRTVWDWCAREPRASLGRALLSELAAIDPAQPADPALLARLQQDWAEFLAQCRQPPYSLSQNLPGRFLLAGDVYAPQAQPFIPLFSLAAMAKDAPPWPKNSLGAVCDQRYEAYRDQVVRPFFAEHFQSLDAQIILIDLLGAMTAGPAALQDMRAAIEGVLAPFRYGRDHWLGRLFRRRIRKVAVCASKIDHLLPADQLRLQSLVESFLYESVQRLAAADIDLQLFAMTAIQSAQLKTDASGAQSLIGVDKRLGERIEFTPPTLPDHLPHQLNLRIAELPVLAPPPGLDRARPFPSRRVDQLIKFLLEAV